MANPNLLLLSERRKIVKEIDNPENQSRKDQSWIQQEVYNGRLRQYVKEHLEGNLDAETVRKMPLISTINIQKRVITQEAQVYSEAPKRIFTNLDDEQEEVIRRIYQDAKANSRMANSNKCFKMQNQNFVMVVPKKGKIEFRILKQHNIDAIPDEDDPENAFAYMISTYDRSFKKDTSLPGVSTGDRGISRHSTTLRDENNQIIGDPDDYKAKLQRILVWSNDYNFKMNGRGEIILKDDNGEEFLIGDVDPTDNQLMEMISNPLKEFEIMPIVDVSIIKEFEFFVRQEDETTEFTIQFNGSATDANQIVRLQGWSQAVVKGPEQLMMEQFVVGPNIVLKLVQDPTSEVETDFEYKSPNSDIPGTIEWLKVLLSLFLSSKGIDPKTISASGEGFSYNSGIERLLALFEKFSVNKDDFTTYKEAEEQIYKIIAAWHNVLKDDDQLDAKYKAKKEISKDSEVKVVFSPPENVESERDRLETFAIKREQGLESPAEFVANETKMSETQAVAKIVRSQLLDRRIQEAADAEGHSHMGMSPAIQRGEGHTHMDLKTGEFVSIEMEGEGHTHLKENGEKSSPPMEGVEF